MCGLCEKRNAKCEWRKAESKTKIRFMQPMSAEAFKPCRILPITDSLPISLPLELTSTQRDYFDCYCKSISSRFSISPEDPTNLLRLFLPMALKEASVLSCIVAWGCVFKNGGVKSNESDYLVSRALETIGQINGSKKSVFFTSFASFMILMCMEISLGDTDAWAKYFLQGFHLIEGMGSGFDVLRQFSSDGIALAEIFVYFDILATQSHLNGTYFPIKEYDNFFRLNTYSGLDSLQGCLKPLILTLGQVVNLIMEIQNLEEDDADYWERWEGYLAESHMLDVQAENASPNPMDVSNLMSRKTSSDFELYLTHFELYQLTIQAHIRHTARRIPAVVPEIQLLLSKIKSRIRALLDTAVRTCLVFPLLISGLICVTEQDKTDISKYIQALLSKYQVFSVNRVWSLVQEVWSRNCHGTLWVDWVDVLRQFGWRINTGR